MSGPEVRGSVTLKQGEFATLDMLHEHAVKIAEEEFEKAVRGPRQPYQCPFLWLVKTPKVLLTIETPWRDDDEKIRSMDMMRTYMAMAQATAYSFMHEAWMSVLQDPNKPMPHSVRELPPDQREDVLIVWTYDRSEHVRQTRWAVRRAGTPRATLLARDDEYRDGLVGGRLGNLLKSPRPVKSTFDRPGIDAGATGPHSDESRVHTIGEAVEKQVLCPHCGKQNELASVLGVEAKAKIDPKDGDVMLCVDCGKFAMFDKAKPGGARKLTSEETFTMGFDPRLTDMRRAWLATSAERASLKKGS